MNRKITAITLQKHNHQRVNIYLGGEFGFGLARSTAGWLQVGQELSEEKIAELKNKDIYEESYQLALNILSYRPRTELEVHRYLEDHQIPAEVITKTIERLKNNELIDDYSFALNWIENRKEFHPRSRKALVFELRKHGIADQIIKEVLNQAAIDEGQLAYQVASKHARNLHGLEWDEFRRKLSGFLVRRGFPYDVFDQTIRQIWETKSANTSLSGETKDTRR
jgi:regulatory protein